MTQEEKWMLRYKEVVSFFETNHRNQSKHNDEERGSYLNWIKHNKKLYATGEMRQERVELFNKLLDLGEKYKRVNQYT